MKNLSLRLLICTSLLLSACATVSESDTAAAQLPWAKPAKWRHEGVIVPGDSANKRCSECGEIIGNGVFHCPSCGKTGYKFRR